MLVLFLFVISVSGASQPKCPFSRNLVDNAILLRDMQYKRDTNLLDILQLTAQDEIQSLTQAVPAYPFAKDADVTMNIQELMKNELTAFTCGNCKPQTFVNLIHSYTNCIPSKYLCPSINCNCDGTTKYRTIDGSCNNIANPTWGAGQTSLTSILPLKFEDGIRTSRRSAVSKEQLIGERELSNNVAEFDDRISLKNIYVDLGINYYDLGEASPNMFFVMYGQFAGHDQGRLVEVKRDPGIKCCSKSYETPITRDLCHSACQPIRVPKDDPHYGPLGVGCLSYTIMQRALSNDCTLKPLYPANTFSSFLDLDIIYGNTEEDSKQIRAFTGGLLKCDNGVLPGINCQNGHCESYYSGDDRIHQTAQLAQIHSLYTLLHNYNCQQLSKLCPRCDDDEKLYQAARQLTIAMHQSIIYNQWLPMNLDRDYMVNQGLLLPSGCTLSPNCYDPKLDPSTLIEFSHGAMRSFHKYIQEEVNTYDCNGKTTNKYHLNETVDNFVLLEKQYDELLRGLLYDDMDIKHIGYADSLRNSFMGKFCADGFDLESIDIRRSREAGVPPYVDYLSFCVSKKIDSWLDLIEYFEPDSLIFLKTQYDNIADIDLATGTKFEKPVFHHTGTVRRCIFALEFKRVKCGDRLFYTNGVFTQAQVAALDNYGAENLLCTLTNIGQYPSNIFQKKSIILNRLKKCSALKPFPYSNFKNLVC